MSLYKKVLKPVRFDAEAVESVPELVHRLGLDETFSDFVRAALNERVERLRSTQPKVAQPEVV